MKRILSKTITVLLWCIAAVYLFAFIKIVILKNGFTREFRSLNLIPFKFIKDFFKAETSLDIFLKNVIGNISIFIPMGILLPVLFEKVDLKKSILICLVVSLSIEVTQYIIGIGMTDIDDLILNTLGGIIGTLLYFKILDTIDKKTGFKFATIIFLFIFGISGVIFLWLFQPNILPNQNIILGQEVLQVLEPESFDLEGVCISIDENSLNTYINSYGEEINSNEETKFIIDSNTAYFQRKIEPKYGPNGNIQKNIIKYEIAIKEDLEKLLEEKDRVRIKLWVSNEEEINSILILN